MCVRGCVPFHFAHLYFSMSTQQEKGDLGPKRDIDGMGVPEVKYGDSVCFIMHVATGLWLSYMAPDAKSSRLGPLKRRVGGKTQLSELWIFDVFYCCTVKRLVLLWQRAVNNLARAVQLSYISSTSVYFNRLNLRSCKDEGHGTHLRQAIMTNIKSDHFVLHCFTLPKYTIVN